MLRELGERLIGRSEIALAELVKNSYDADARRCRVEIHVDRIVVEDDGSGMTLDEFRRFWMRVGTTHKQALAKSRTLGRPLTGSKGVGRLAVQFLAEDIEILTRAPGEGRYLQVKVDWNKAVSAGDLTQAQAEFRLVEGNHLFPGRSQHGTRIVLGGLKQSWGSIDQARALAQQLWMLQPPFGPEANDRNPKAFSLDFVSGYPGLEEAFRRQMGSVLENWEARLIGRVRDGRRTNTRNITLEFRNGDTFADIPISPQHSSRCRAAPVRPSRRGGGWKRAFRSSIRCGSSARWQSGSPGARARSSRARTESCACR